MKDLIKTLFKIIKFIFAVILLAFIGGIIFTLLILARVIEFHPENLKDVVNIVLMQSTDHRHDYLTNQSMSLVEITRKKSNKNVATFNIGHIVQFGETIYSIGRKYQVKPLDIIKINNLTEPNKIAPGEKLIIPSTQSRIN